MISTTRSTISSILTVNEFIVDLLLNHWINRWRSSGEELCCQSPGAAQFDVWQHFNMWVFLKLKDHQIESLLIYLFEKDDLGVPPFIRNRHIDVWCLQHALTHVETRCLKILNTYVQTCWNVERSYIKKQDHRHMLLNIFSSSLVSLVLRSCFVRFEAKRFAFAKQSCAQFVVLSLPLICNLHWNRFPLCSGTGIDERNTSLAVYLTACSSRFWRDLFGCWFEITK